MGVLERADHLDGRIGTEPVRIGHLQRDLHLGLSILGDLRDDEIRTLAVAEHAGAIAGGNLQFEPQRLEELRGLAPVAVSRNTASIPSVAMS
jgi:hypothetical protein